MIHEPNIGRNIRYYRNLKGWSQNTLAQKAGFSNTTLSAYENGKKIPGLNTLASIAEALGITLDQLYYGDESQMVISKSSDDSMAIVNCAYYLWEKGVLRMNYVAPKASYKNDLAIFKYHTILRSFVEQLDDFKKRKTAYPDPDLYLEQVIKATANEIKADDIKYVVVGEKVPTPPTDMFE